jgi:2-(1,2-epoxy-1,2-dihydrophenyl)acetyl-CoA isomerase
VSRAHVTVERVDGVGRLVLDRPEEYNSLSAAMAAELRDAAVELVEDDDVRAVVVAGSGPAFCAGADLEALAGDATDARRLRTVATRLHTAVAHLAGAPKPTVTAVEGVAAGGGFGLALAGDLVLVHEDARFEYTYPRIGLSGDGGSTWLLPRLVGRRRAREVVLLDEPIDPEEAVADGLATEVVPDDEFDDRVAELAADLADDATRAHAATMRLIDRSFGRDLRAQLAAETDSLARLTATGDYERGYEAFFGDGEPAFEGR